VNRIKSSFLPSLIPYILLLIMVLPLAAPYLEPGYQFADDRYAPYLRVEALRQAIADGQVPPRWFAEFDGGYGSPYPSFYAMLFYYAAAGINALGMNVGAAVELSAFLAIVMAAIGIFVLARSLWGVGAGLLSAALYTYAPYHLVDAFVRGALSELAAFAWFPFIVYTTYQAILTHRKTWLVLSALSIAGLVLTHNLMPIIFLPVILTVLGLVAVLIGHSRRARWAGLGAVGVSAVLGLLVSAYLWLPIVVERSLLRLEYFLQYDFHGDFVSRGTMFAWASSEPPYTSVGLILVGAAIVGSLVVVWSGSRSSHRLLALGALAAGVFFLFMATRRSAWIWEHVPLLPLVQFPWRFLAPASFCLALAAGPFARLFGNEQAGWGVAIVLGTAIYIQSGPLIHIAHQIDAATIENMPICQEVWGTQDYRPATSRTLFWRGETPPADPADPHVLLPCEGSLTLSSAGDAQVRSISRQGTRWEVQYAAERPASATIPQFYFPGWSARVDGVSIPVGPSAGNGLVQVSLPAGEHSLEVEYHDTPVRASSDVLSLLGIVALAFLAWPARFQMGRKERDGS
jgi:hypothetical protein